MNRLVVIAAAAAILPVSGCAGEQARDQGDGRAWEYISLEEAGNTVRVPIPSGMEPSAFGDFGLEVLRDVPLPVSNQVAPGPDSLSRARMFPLGGGAVLALTVFPTDPGDLSLADSLLERSILVRWHGLRPVRLSDVCGDSIDVIRESSPRAAPLVVNHDLVIDFTPASSESSLVLVDTISFSGGDSVLLSVHPGIPGDLVAVTGTAGHSTSSAGVWLCGASDDSSSGTFLGVFTGVLPRNWHITDASGEGLLGRSRMNSALLGGRYVPVGDNTNRFRIRVNVPPGMRVFCPIPLVYSEDGGSRAEFSTGTELVRGVVPVFMGDFRWSLLHDRRTRLVVQSGLDTTFAASDSMWAGDMSSMLWSVLGFPEADFSILVVEGGSEGFAMPYHGCLVVSPGVLSELAGVFAWGDSLAAGSSAPGTRVVAAGAACFTGQSVFLDPVLAQVIHAWMPCRFMDYMSDDDGIFKMRRAYRNYYLYQTAVTGGEEPALADPALRTSPLSDPVILGKGPVVMEYLYTQGCLGNLPEVLENFRHAGSYWSKIWANLGLYEGERRYRILRQFLYQPGIPQVDTEWWEEDGRIILYPRQMQPSDNFGILFGSCKLFLQDGTSRTVVLNPGDRGILYGVLPPDAEGRVVAVDLNPDESIPADMVYRRRPFGSR
jgi:hypothetical protein